MYNSIVLPVSAPPASPFSFGSAASKESTVVASGFSFGSSGTTTGMAFKSLMIISIIAGFGSTASAQETVKNVAGASNFQYGQAAPTPAATAI